MHTVSMAFLFRLLSWFPLWLLHGLGAVLGWLGWCVAASYRRRVRENAALAGLTLADVRPSIAHNGRMLSELPRLWLGRPVHCEWRGLEYVEQAYAAGKGVVFLTPHMGCFEITAQAMAERFHRQYGDLTVLYRPASQPWLAEMMETVRERPGLRSVPTNLSGIRQMIKALRHNEAVGLLPDHVPPPGQGVWVPFFGKEAYTMTLAARLMLQTQAAVIIIWGERLSWGRGYRLHCSPPSAPLPDELEAAVAQINREMERVILRCPGQYMWGYARYRAPYGWGDYIARQAAQEEQQP